MTRLAVIVLVGVIVPAQTSDPKPPVTGSAMTAAEAKEFLDYHNQVRKEVGVGPVAWSKEVAEFAQEHDIPVLSFAKGERKLDVMRPHLDRLIGQGRSGVAAIGKAQEFQRVFTGTTYHSEPDGGGAVRFGYHKADRRVTAYYFYLVDEVFGPAFVKVCAYFPYPCKIWLNGHEYAKRAATAAGIGFTELDNGFATTDDPAGLQRICETLGPGTIAEFCQRWWARLPLPLTDADRAAGYWWDIAMRQVDVFPHMVIQMTAIGEESGALDTMLFKVAEFYEQEVNNAVDALSSLLEPFIMLIIGVIVGGMVIGMYLPVFKLAAAF